MNKTEAISRFASMAATIEGLPDDADILGCSLSNGGERPYVQIPHEQLLKLDVPFSCERVTSNSVELTARSGDVVDIVAIWFSPMRKEGIV